MIGGMDTNRRAMKAALGVIGVVAGGWVGFMLVGFASMLFPPVVRSAPEDGLGLIFLPLVGIPIGGAIGCWLGIHLVDWIKQSRRPPA